MARVAGVTLPNKRTEIALTYIHGVGLSRSKKILAETKIDKDKRVNDLTEDEIDVLRNYIKEQYIVEGDLKREKILAIRRLQENKSYRGLRHSKRLPVRGQSTRRNSRTVKGNSRTTVGSGRKSAGQKT